MAALLKNIFQISKHFGHNLGFSSRFFSSDAVKDVHNRLVVPFSSHNVKHFGNLRVFSENLGVHVTASNSYGEESLVALSLVSDCTDNLKEDLVALREFVCCNVDTEGDELSYITIHTDANAIMQKFKPCLLEKMKLLINVPHSYGLLIHCASQQAVTVEKLECDGIEIHTKGDCILSELKSHLITVNSVVGDIVSKSSLIGDLTFTTSANGGVCLSKIQGNQIKIVTEDGDVRVASLYGGDVLINTECGNVTIGDAHGNIDVTSRSSDINCGSISGHLNAVTEDGNIMIKLTSGGNVWATSRNGNATIKLDLGLKCRLELSSKTMNISPDINMIESEKVNDDVTRLTGETQGDGKNCAKVMCSKGNIDLLQESWFVMP
ncbi:protein FAM185A-like [Dendronephthya gigantea]|uniref:protein FAM185A-like n=1 Tax=Dendronephthya gigantea TaxID=151771 RepID=UPI00106B60A7|nr:protein FAM185A-like [Dendronephthya gigantea]